MFYDMPSIYYYALQFLSSQGQLGFGKVQKSDPTETAKNIKDFGMIEVVNSQDPANYIQTINIIGQIEGHGVASPQTKSTKYEHVIPQLIAMEQNPNVRGVLITLNTLGGDVEAGLAIAEMINSLSMPTVIGFRWKSFYWSSACNCVRLCIYNTICNDDITSY